MRALEAEQTVLGSILIDPRCLDTVARILRPQDMAIEIDRALYQAALSMERSGAVIDPVTIKDWVLKTGGQVSGEYLLQLMDTTPTAANAEEYARIVRIEAQRRGALELSEHIKAEVEAHADPQQLLMEIARRVGQIQEEGMGKDLLSPDEAMMALYRHRERIGDGSAFVRTGYRDLDKRLGGGLLNSGMYILAARPGMGKTTLAINIADRVAREGKDVLFVSLEMEPEQLDAKRIARETGIPADRILMGVLTEDEERSFADAADVIRALPVHINRRDTATVDQIETMARQVRGLSLIVIDYIGKILPDTRGRMPGRVEYMTEISGAIKDLARRFRVPVLVLCQLNRAPAGRQDPRPILTDLRDTGALEQDADGVIFLYRQDYYDGGRGGQRSDLNVNLAKNRHGDTGDCTMVFDMASSKMTTSQYRPIARRKEKDRLGATQMSWEDLSDKLDKEFPFDGGGEA